MQIKYHTQKGSTYVQKTQDGNEFWFKEDADGQMRALDGGVHITVRSLHKIYMKTPSLSDRTYCFDIGGKEELFENAKKERCGEDAAEQDTLIFFLLKNENGEYGVGCSSLIKEIEKID